MPDSRDSRRGRPSSLACSQPICVRFSCRRRLGRFTPGLKFRLVTAAVWTEAAGQLARSLLSRSKACVWLAALGWGSMSESEQPMMISRVPSVDYMELTGLTRAAATEDTQNLDRP